MSWTAVGGPHKFGGTGGMLLDNDGSTVVVYAATGHGEITGRKGGSNCQFWTNSSANLSTWILVPNSTTRFPLSNDSNCDSVYRDAGNQKWFALTAGRIGGYPGDPS